MLEKVGGFLTIVVAVTGLALTSAYQPPTWMQIVLALIGSTVCLIGVVFMFAEGRIFTKDRKVKTTAKAD
jgi:archaellum biogenesis protein FlaJ (TadC family)